ncbi:hypothetical protein [Paenibacillus thiaminolyticus]|nr:hypothetical protein [Paenibacillus thiaminolyticus]
MRSKPSVSIEPLARPGTIIVCGDRDAARQPGRSPQLIRADDRIGQCRDAGSAAIGSAAEVTTAAAGLASAPEGRRSAAGPGPNWLPQTDSAMNGTARGISPDMAVARRQFRAARTDSACQSVRHEL